MRSLAKFAAVLFTLVFGATMLLAQEPRSGGNNSSGSHSSGRAFVSSPAGHVNTSPQNFHRHLGTQPSPPYQSPFNQQIHLPGGGTSGGYGYYGGYGHGGYGYTGYQGDITSAAGPTTTDRVLANGGTFNNINEAPDGQGAQQQQQPIYIRPEYSTQYADNSTINTPVAASTVSAASDSPAILKFKDGTEMTVHNYAIYGAYIVVLTPERHKYPIANLDVAATQKANEAASYELHLPAVFTSH
jgi:hypothetical protein